MSFVLCLFLGAWIYGLIATKYKLHGHGKSYSDLNALKQVNIPGASQVQKGRTENKGAGICVSSERLSQVLLGISMAHQ